MNDDIYSRGKILASQHRVSEWFVSFMEFARKADATSAWVPQIKPILPHKAEHDREQEEYRRQAGIMAGPGLHIECGDRLDGATINPNTVGEAVRQWNSAIPQVVVIDDFLTPQALDALRQYCWGSDMWRQSYVDGYLGAFPEHGFAAPLLAQIAEEFWRRFSDICGDYPLKYVWAFKYGSEKRGIGVHADEAAVNVNFWITPDEANLDPESGGLVIWDKAAPLDWDFSKYNGNVAAIRDFLSESGANKRKISHRANRAVIFDSDLFHETDRLSFQEGYQNRRINVTLLYGEREKQA